MVPRKHIVRRSASIPIMPRPYNGLGGFCAISRQDYDGAIAAFRRAIELGLNDGRAHFNLGNALCEKGAPDEAITAYRQAIALNPKDGDIPLLVGRGVAADGPRRGSDRGTPDRHHAQSQPGRCSQLTWYRAGRQRRPRRRHHVITSRPFVSSRTTSRTHYESLHCADAQAVVGRGDCGGTGSDPLQARSRRGTLQPRSSAAKDRDSCAKH